MFVYAAIIISVIGLCFATYTDLKERIVPNKLNYGLALIGLIIFGSQSLFEMNSLPILLSLIGLFWGFFFGWILWKIGIFAGGDVKLFMGLGALNPLTPGLLNLGIFSGGTLFLFPISLFIYSLVAFLPYGLIFVLYKLSKNKKFRKKVFLDMKEKTLQGAHASFFLAGMYLILNLLGVNLLIGIPLLIIWGLFRKKKIFITIIVSIVALLINALLFAQALVGVLVMIVFVYGLIRLMFSLRPLLSSKTSVDKLEEGMIPANTLVWKGKKVVELEGITLSNIIKYAKEHRIGELFKQKNVIVSATKARGLNEGEMKKLKELARKGLIPKKIGVKESMPFVPTMLIGYLLAIILGDFLWTIILGL